MLWLINKINTLARDINAPEQLERWEVINVLLLRALQGPDDFIEMGRRTQTFDDGYVCREHSVYLSPKRCMAQSGPGLHAPCG